MPNREEAVNPNTREQIIIKGNPTLPVQFLNASIEEKDENQIKYQSTCRVIVSRGMQMKIWVYENLEETLSPILVLDWDEKENPLEFLTEWLSGFLTGKKKTEIQWNYALRNVSKIIYTDSYVVCFCFFERRIR